MLGVTSGSKLFRSRKNRSERKENAMRIKIKSPFNEDRMKISIKKLTFYLP